MPMLAVVALAAAGTAGAVASGIALATAITYVGVGMSVIGAVTGNKNFSKIGAIMGLAGGVMNIANIGTAAGSSVGGSESLTDALAQSGTDIGAEQAAAGWDDIASGVAKTSEDVANGTSALSGTESMAVPPSGVTDATQSAVASPPSAQGGLLNATEQPVVAPAITGAPVAEPFSTPMIQNDYGTSSALPSTGVTGNINSSASSESAKEIMKKAAPSDPSWWGKLPDTTKNELIRAGWAGLASFGPYLSSKEKMDWDMAKSKEQQANLNAQPTILRYQKPAGLLGATTQKVA